MPGNGTQTVQSILADILAPWPAEQKIISETVLEVN